MSYALGQAKWIPGQISFTTTRSGRLPNVQPLIEAGLPYAPYIEHGSWTTGAPDIARYGRDPYRGLGTGPDVEMATDEARRLATEAIQRYAPPATLIGTSVAAGAAGGLIGGLLGRSVIGTLLGAAGGGGIGYLVWNAVKPRSTP